MTLPPSPVTLGKTLRRFEADGFVLTESAHPPALTLPPHLHGLASIACVLEGSFTEVLGGRPQACGPASVVVKPAGEIHSDRYGHTGARCLLIEVKPERGHSIRRFSSILDRAVHLRGGAMPALALRIYREFRRPDAVSGLCIEGLVFEMLAEGSRLGEEGAASALPRWFRRARDYVHENCGAPLGLTSVAEAVDVHPAHLAKAFRRHCGCTLGDYVRRLRLDRATEELLGSEKPLVEIALGAGFYDQSHFTRAFKLHTGMTPARFRAALRGRRSTPSD